MAYTGNNSNQKSKNKAPKYDKQGNKSGKPNIKAPKYARQGDKSGKLDNKAPKCARQDNKSGKPGKPAHALMKQAKNPTREQKAVDPAALRESLILKFDSLITSDNPRTLLSQIRQLLKDCPGALRDEDVFYSYATVEPIILACLTHEDAKTRKNAALVLQTIAEEYGLDIFGDDQVEDPAASDEAPTASDLPSAEVASYLYAAYKAEETMFVRSAYLEALKCFDCEPYRAELMERLTFLKEESWAEGDLKHVREERHAIESLFEAPASEMKSEFKGLDREMGILLVIDEAVREAAQTELGAGARVVPGGVRLTTSSWKKVQSCRLYKEALFPVPLRKGSQITVSNMGSLVADSKLIPMVDELLKAAGDSTQTGCAGENAVSVGNAAENAVSVGNAAENAGSVGSAGENAVSVGNAAENAGSVVSVGENAGAREHPFRMEIRSSSDEDRSGAALKRAAAELEEASKGRLRNSKTAYEFTLVLMAKRDGSLSPYIKLPDSTDHRFDYRKNSEATSMSAVMAAEAVQMIRPYLKDGAQVIDPFAGVGTLLIERAKAVPHGDLYATDIYGHAVIGGRENAELAGVNISYINRDFFDFKHDYPFDEVITEFPDLFNKEAEEKEEFFRNFFRSAMEVTADKAMLFLISAEDKAMHKHIRLNPELRIVSEIEFRGHEKIYVIDKKS
ncbi:MAG: methyltransferase [Lachnospiraceae bacterium]|nr:methyltransferase [Lachnospiraceae bacterium]